MVGFSVEVLESIVKALVLACSVPLILAIATGLGIVALWLCVDGDIRLK